MKIRFILLLLVIAAPSNTDEFFQVRQLNSFSWDSCGDANDATTIHYVNISPDPVVLPGYLSVDVNATATLDLNSPATLNLKLDRRVLDDWVELPCSDHFGTCTYPNFCPLLDVIYPPSQPCPTQYTDTGAPCRCPFQAGDYYIHGLTVHLDINIPALVLDGDYHMGFNFSSGQQQFTCFDVYFTMMAVN